MVGHHCLRLDTLNKKHIADHMLVIRVSRHVDDDDDNSLIGTTAKKAVGGRQLCMIVSPPKT